MEKSRDWSDCATQGIIKVKSGKDEIFEEDDDDFADILVPKIEMGVDKTEPTKRKQTLIPQRGDFQEMLEFIEPVKSPPTCGGNRKGTRRKEPLYLLDPGNLYCPKERMRVRRAIVTHRHHFEKKMKIVELTEENQVLRRKCKLLEAKLIQLYGKARASGIKLDFEVPDFPTVKEQEKLHSQCPGSRSSQREKLVVNIAPPPTPRSPVLPISSSSSPQPPILNPSSPKFPKINLKGQIRKNISVKVTPLPSTSDFNGGLIPLTALMNEAKEDLYEPTFLPPEVPSSRIVFAKKGRSTKAAITASQLFLQNKKLFT